MNVYVMTDDNGWQDEQKIQTVTSFFYMYKATNIMTIPRKSRFRVPNSLFASVEKTPFFGVFKHITLVTISTVLKVLKVPTLIPIVSKVKKTGRRKARG